MATQHFDYDKNDPSSIEAYAKRLKGKTFRDIVDEDTANGTSIIDSPDYKESHENKKRKGGLGELVEERYFHYPANSNDQPDFEEAGVELKVTPYKKNRNGSLSAKERLVIDMIDYNEVVNEDFEDSKFWRKSRLLLIIYYLYRKELEDRLDYRIDFVQLFTPPENDRKIIEEDFRTIVEKIRAGKAHELSESDTHYLSAATKGKDSSKTRTQPFSDIPAKPRAFALKASYMTYVLNSFMVPGKATYEPILPEGTDIPLEKYVVDKIDSFKGMSVVDIEDRTGYKPEKKPKGLGALLAYRMLSIKGNQAEEFVKADIAVKTIRIQSNGKIKECMSFPTFKFRELVEEDWEDSTLRTYLSETRFLFVVYRQDEDGEYFLKGCQFWNMPYDDLEGHVRKVWERARAVINDGSSFRKEGKYYVSSLPKASEDPVCHVRPHGKDSTDQDVLPNGKTFPKQCFWLNNTYILSQLDEDLREN